MRRHAISRQRHARSDRLRRRSLAALDEGLIGGAGLDVTDPEPLPAGHRLWTHPRAVVTPHTAGGSRGAPAASSRPSARTSAACAPASLLLALIDKQKGY